MTIRAGYFSTTTSFAVTATPDGFTVAGSPESRHVFLVQSPVVVHVTRDGTDAAPATALRIPANTPVLIATFAADEISFVLGTGETDDIIWFTETDH